MVVVVVVAVAVAVAGVIFVCHDGEDARALRLSRDLVALLFGCRYL